MAKTTIPVIEDRLIIARPAGKTTSKRVQRPSARGDVRRASSTRALFQYHRDDNTPNKVTVARIDAGLQAASPVNPNVFGNFIEHLGGVVYQALWSQVLLNPNLERIEARDTLPAAWQKSGAASWQADGYRSPMYIRLGSDTKNAAAAIILPDSGNSPVREQALISGNKSGSAGRQSGRGSLAPASWKQSVPRAASLWQHVSLSAQRVTHYNVTLVARVRKGGGRIRVVLVREKTVTPESTQGKQEASLSNTFAVTQSDWQAFHCTLVVPKSKTPEENMWRFMIVHEDGQAVDVDQVEMFPNDSVDGFDRIFWGEPAYGAYRFCATLVEISQAATTGRMGSDRTRSARPDAIRPGAE